MLIFFLLPIFAATSCQLKHFIQEFQCKAKTVKGGAIAIVHKGKIVYKKTFGAQGDTEKPITSHTLFPLGSSSKAITSMTIGYLAQKNTINLREKFTLPWLKHKVSLIDILGHTAGIESPFWGNLEIEAGQSRQQILKLLSKQKLSIPGKSYAYTNVLFSLVEEVLEIKGTNFPQALQNFRTCLGTDEIQVIPIDACREIAYPHMKENGQTKTLPFPPYYPKVVMTAAGIFASLDGMIKFLQLICGYRSDVLSKTMLAQMYKPRKKNKDITKWVNKGIEFPCDLNQIESWYGLGWRVLRSKTNPEKDMIYHPGYIAGINTFVGVIPSEDIGIVIMMNEASKTALPLQEGLNFWGLFLKQDNKINR